MASANPQPPAGRSLSDTLARLPNLSDKIIKASEQYCEAGAFGDVYKCQYDSSVGWVQVWTVISTHGSHTLTAIQVAVKSFRFPFTLDATENNNDEKRGVKAQKMIRRELGIWRRLEHQNIVPFLGIAYGFGRQGQASLVSLWMANGSLRGFLAEHDDQLAVSHRLQLLSDIANGLCYLHSFVTPIVHGDLSCTNVLLDDNCVARLTDFGYASMIGDIPEALLYLQMTTMKPGTIRWAAPEHFLVDVDQPMRPTTQSDIYSLGNLGLLASIVLSGKHPWSEIQREAAVIIQLSRGIKPKRPLSRPIQDQHWELIERCWAPVGDRPPAEDVVSSLQEFMRASPLSLAGGFRVSSHSIHTVEQNTGPLDANVEPPSLPEAILGYQSTVFRDGKWMLPTLGPINSHLPRPYKRRHYT
ncbi:kinase-like domain-containing protein [Boletus edulis]|nr:kinase-like domain-containing protein [Boletus edulis]